jgi:hypothetical protein
MKKNWWYSIATGVTLLLIPVSIFIMFLQCFGGGGVFCQYSDKLFSYFFASLLIALLIIFLLIPRKPDSTLIPKTIIVFEILFFTISIVIPMFLAHLQ